jgi:hypothetical protein
MYLLTPTTALDLARYRVEQDLARAEKRRLVREAKAARREDANAERSRRRPTAPRRRWTLPRPVRVRIAH